MFSTDELNVKGNISLHPQNRSTNGVRHGGHSFQIPGLDPETTTEGTCVIIDETAADDKTVAGFSKLHALLQEERSHQTLEDIVAIIAQSM